MKQFITLLSLALMTTGVAGAQSFSAGARTGAGCIWQSFDHKYTSFEQSVFGRYETGKKWAFEAGLGHWGGGMGTTVVLGTPDEGLVSTDAHARLHNYEMNLSVQYDISCPYMQEHCPVMRRIHTYASLDISPTWSHSNLLYHDRENVLLPETSHRKNEFRIWTGMSETMIFNLNEHFNLVSNAGFKIDPARLLSKPDKDYQPNARFSFQVGAAYRF